MAVPGFSVSDLIAALQQSKRVYDGFFDKNKNTASQVSRLAEDIDEFRVNLQNHQDIIERHGLEYSGYRAVRRTLEECDEFLVKYQSALDDRFSVVGAFRKGRFPFVQDDVSRLRGQIARHGDNILHYSMNLVLDNSLRNGSIVPGSTATSLPLPIQNHLQNQPSTSVTPPSSPPARFNSPTMVSNSYLSSSPLVGGLSPILRATRPGSIGSPRRSPVLSPLDERGPSRRESTLVDKTLDNLVLPQSALPYIVATIFFEGKKIELKRKPVGRNFNGGREFVIVDEFSKPRFAHRIRLPQTQPPYQSCFPFTWHSRWEDHKYEVTFKGSSPEHHSIMFKGQLYGSGVPRYKFSLLKDYIEFQSQVRGKDLVSSFDIRQIKASTKHRQATDQHLKIWRDRVTQEHSISFYASATEKPCDFEFPISMFNQDLKASSDASDVDLDFTLAIESSSKRKMSRAFSRSPTERSNGSTSGPSIFSRTQTGLTSTTATTVLDSRMSIASFGSDSSQSERRNSKSPLSPLESQAKSLKCFNIEFSDGEDAKRFRAEWARVWKEDVARPLDFFLQEWQRDTAQRAESVASTSGAEEMGSGTPTRELAGSLPAFELEGAGLVELG